MRLSQKFILGVLLLMLVVLAIAGCGGSSGHNNTGGPTPTTGRDFTEDFESYNLGSVTFPLNNWTVNNATAGTDLNLDIFSDGGSKVLRGTALSTPTPHLVNSTAIGTNDYSVSAKVKSGESGDRIGVIARWASKNQFYALYYKSNAGTPTLYLTGKVGGTNTDITNAPITVPGFDISQYHVIKLVVSGSNPIHLQGFLDDVKLIDVNDTDLTRTSGQFGLYCSLVSNGTTYWDDVAVNPVSTPTPTPTPIVTNFMEEFESYNLGSVTFPLNNWTVNNAAAGTDLNLDIFSDGGSKVLRGTALTTPTPHLINSTAIGSNDYSVSAKVKSGESGDRIGVIARWASKNQFYALYYKSNAGTPTLYLTGKVGGTNTDITNAPITISGFDISQYHVIKLVVSGSNPIHLQGFLDDVKLIDVNDTDLTRTSGQFGLYCSLVSNGTTYWDDVTVNY